MKAFPGTVKPKSDISGALMAHLRYPQDLFKVQRELLTRYHVDGPAAPSTAAASVWQVPDDPTTKSGDAVPPYYLSMKMPDQTAPAFSLTTTLHAQRAGQPRRLHGGRRRRGHRRLRQDQSAETADEHDRCAGPQQVQSEVQLRTGHRR